MTAKMKHGHKAHPAAHGADPGTAHERLNRMHAMPGRPEGAMAGAGGAPMQGPMESPPPMAGGAPGAMPGAPMGAGPSPDDEESEQS